MPLANQMNRDSKFFKLPSNGEDEEDEADFYEKLLAQVLASSTDRPNLRRKCDCEYDYLPSEGLPQFSTRNAFFIPHRRSGVDGASIGPPKNVRVQALTNSSVVVQWDFDEVANDGFADGFVVKYMHEPSGSSVGPDHYSRSTAGSGQDNWRTQTVMDSKARHLEITRLSQKPYAFCVLAIKHSRLGPCSDPPITLDKLKPTFVVQDLHVQYKTSQSVALHWEYTGPSTNIGFYIKQMGMKTYQDQYLEEKTLIGVYSLDDGRLYWPRELSVQTDPTGPPFVDTPEFMQSPSPTTAYLRLSCASEEYGPINHYWLIVVPGNYTKEDVVNVDSAHLQRSTSKHRAVATDISNNTYSVMQKRHNSKSGGKRAVSLRQVSPRQLDGGRENIYTGDGKEYEGYLNVPLDVNIKYQLMTRAFTREDSWRRSSDHPFEFRPPMQEPASRLFTDSMLTAPFSTRSSILTSSTMGRASNIWLVGPAIAIFVILVIVGMLVVWWLRCSRKSFRALNTHHGSVTKVALGMTNTNGEFNSNGGVPNETSKLLLGMDADGRPVMNAYERPELNETQVLNMYPNSNLSHTNPCLNNNSSQGQLNNGGFATIGNIHSQHQLSSSNMMLNSSSMASAQPTPIPLTQFATHIDRLKMNNNAMFIQEYESIETGQHFTWENSMLDVNKHKNRYANVVAYDHSRVILSGDSSDGSDYINANYIDGYEKPRAYIATQGPLPETFADFWRMVWEERSVTIVMLTRLEERSRTKCDQYWPTRGSSVYGNFRVTLLDTTELAHYCIRVMRLEDLRTKEHREIQHAQFTAWPDHGVPNHPTPFLMFLKRVKSLNPIDAGPILTHCSAGIGRTGAFIVIDCMLDRLRYELTIDIYGCVKAIRAQRSYMVQTDDQYIFIHDAVLDAAQSGSTEVPSNKLAQHVQVLSHPQRQMDDATGLEIEFGTLVTLKCPNSKCMAANLMMNSNKNRTPNTIPYDANRVELPFQDGQEGSDYINASWIDGYRTRNAYIAAQAPLANTVNDFWRMIWNEECCLIAMLTNLAERGQEKCCEYWPNERRENYDGLIVDCVSEFDMTHYMLREFKITQNETGKSRTVRQFQFMEWPDRESPTQLTDSWTMFVRFTRPKPSLEAKALFVCTALKGQAGREHVVDIFTAVKLLRMQRQNMVDSRDQYEFCYAAAIEFLNSYEEN
uniref:Protein-tyrosine-phosphatase n=1 Tax=Ditylenchus dipsaci TaxID=166011 RepID=A0A915DHU2_9BILA